MFGVTLRKDIYSEKNLRELGFNDRQIKAVMHVKERGKITNKEYRRLTGLSEEGARIDLGGLVKKGLFQLKEKGRSAHYILKKFGD